MGASKLLFFVTGLLWVLLLASASQAGAGAVCSLLPIALALTYISIASVGGLGASNRPFGPWAPGEPPTEGLLTPARQPAQTNLPSPLAEDRVEEVGRPARPSPCGPDSRPEDVERPARTRPGGTDARTEDAGLSVQTRPGGTDARTEDDDRILRSGS
ncbi:MAG TPA: hypothetical protein VF498_02455 [Anaerolineales bacterium]